MNAFSRGASQWEKDRKPLDIAAFGRFFALCLTSGSTRPDFAESVTDAFKQGMKDDRKVPSVSERIQGG